MGAIWTVTNELQSSDTQITKEVQATGKKGLASKHWAQRHENEKKGKERKGKEKKGHLSR